MANHFQYRFTPAPSGATPITTVLDLSGILLLKFDKLAIGYETKDKKGNPAIPHYHIYGETDYKEDSIRTKLRDILNIPKTSQGKGNAYSSLQFNRYTEPFPAYVLKWGNVVASKGYSEEEIQKYIEEGKQKFLKNEVRLETVMEAPGGRQAAAKRSIEDVFDEYVEAVLPKDRTQEFSIDSLKRLSIRYWRSKSRLLPQTSTRNRFMASAWLEWCDIIRKGECLAIADLELKNML